MLLPECTETCYIEIPALVLIGFGYSLMAGTVWSIVPYVVPQKSTGTAFGICACFTNTALAFSPLIGGLIHDHTIEIQFGFYWVIICNF